MPTTSKSGYFTNEQEQTARFAKAMGHPVRIAILQLLNNQTCCFHGDMAEELPVAKSTLSQHLNELKDAGLIQGSITPPTVRYCINRENWNLAIGLLNGILTPNMEHNVAVVANPEQLMKPQGSRPEPR
jgi:ArsR family transcriptional regulator